MEQAKEYWNSLSIKQRDHFLKDHKNHFKRSSWLSWLGKDFSELPTDVQKVIAEHVKEGLYKKGGSFSEFLAKAKSKVDKTLSSAKKNTKSVTETAKSKYSESKKYVADKVKDQKRKIALDVLDSTIRKTKNPKDKISLKAAEEIVTDKYAEGGNFDIGSEIVFFDKYYDKNREGTITSILNDREFEVATNIGTKLVERKNIIGLADKVQKKKSWFFNEGGSVENGIDLFEDYENIPADVQEVLDRNEDAFVDGDYKGLEKAHRELESIGYTFEYYLDGQAYDLRPIGTKGKSEFYAKGGGVGNELTRGEIENKIDGLKLRIAKTKKQISTYENTNRGKYNNLWQEKVVPLQNELNELSELWGKSKYANGGGVGRDYRIYYNKKWTNIIVSASNKDEAFEKSKQQLQELYPNEKITKSKWAYSNTYFDKKAKGGHFENENREMVLNNNKQISHHTKELEKAVAGKHVPAWVVAKVNRSASDLSDATHYMDGQGEMYAKGGLLDSRDEHEGYNYQVWYLAPIGYYVKGSDMFTKKIFEGENNYFRTSNEAKEHAEITIRMFLSDTIDESSNYQYAKGGNLTMSDLNRMIAEYNSDGRSFELRGAYGNLELWSKGNRLEVGSKKDIYNALVKYRFNERYDTGGNTSEWCDCLDADEIEFACSVANRIVQPGVYIDHNNLKYLNKDEIINAINSNMEMFSDEGKKNAQSLLNKLNK
jgi:hypothetical protein